MDNKNFFSLAIDYGESVSLINFFHPNKTEVQFKEDVDSLFKKYAAEFLEMHVDAWITINDWSEFVSNKLPELGYQKIKPFIFGYYGYSLINYDDTKPLSEEEEIFKKMIGDDYFEKAREINKKIDQQLFDDLDIETKEEITKLKNNQ